MADHQLEAYVDSIQRRLLFVRALSMLAGLLLLITAITALGTLYVALQVPSAERVAVLRIAAVCVILALPAWLYFRVSAPDVIAELERRLPALGGRLQTWRDARTQPAAGGFRALLAQQTLAVFARQTPAQVVSWRQWLLPLLMLSLLLGALGLLIAGTGGFSLAAQRFWLGDTLSGAAPELRVIPGDVTIPQGFDVVVEARSENFQAGDVRLFARYQSSTLWQETRMSRLGSGVYGFVFVAVDEPIDYYVQAAGISSTRYRIGVADLPRVISVAVTANYPDWSGLAAESVSDGDVAALPDSRIDVRIELDRPDVAAFLVAPGHAAGMNTSGMQAEGAFTVTEGGTWHVAVEHQGALVRISESFQVRLLKDEPPQLNYVWPGRDRQATAIEEVDLEFAASDDYGVNSLALHVAVNGGSWQRTQLEVKSATHLLALESLLTPEGRSLAAGDVISLYVSAADHRASARSPLYFIDVRPFDRRYRESSQGGSGGQGAGDQLDIAERQKEILSATWNLVNKAPDTDQQELQREADVVAMLQRKLAEQVQVLIERAQARSLDQDDTVAEFVASLAAALEEMPQAAQLLERGSLQAALAPEGRALAALRAAEATIRDMDVSMGDSRGRGTLSDSLSELMDLELDRERNRYETPQSLNPTGSSQDPDPAWQQLAELAARQQQLAEQNRSGQSTPASRWQQQQLQRQLEALREQLANRRSGSGGPDQQALEQAISALDQASESLRQTEPGAEQTQRAGEALRSAARSLQARELAESAQQLSRLKAQADRLLAAQEAVLERLRAAQERSVLADEEGDFDPWQDFSMLDDVATKAAMRDQLGELRAGLAEAIVDAGDDRALSEALVNAQGVLDDQRIDERLAASADAFEMGRPLYALAHEEIVERGLRLMTDYLGQAQVSQAQDDGRAPGGESLNQSALATLRSTLDAARGDGEVDAADAALIADVSRQAEALARRLEGRGATTGIDRLLQASRDAYNKRGLNTDDPEQLLRMAEATLDLLEVAVNAPPSGDLQIEEQRPAQRDADEVAEYFRRLSDEADR